jgi:hypothetical protein
MKKNSTLLISILLLFSTALYAGKIVQVVLFHNDGYKITQTYYPNDSVYKRTVNDMLVYRKTNRNKTFGVSAKLIRTIRKRSTKYFKISQKLVKYYKQKWSKRHYQEMDEEWKDNTFKKHRDKLKLFNSLSLDLQKAFNKWNAARNKAVKLKNKKALISSLKKANAELSKAIKKEKKKEATVYEELADELDIVKMMK